MFSKLYSNVFGVDQSSFNASDNYYTVILNFAKNTEYSEQLSSNIGHYINKNAYDERSFELSEAGDEGLGDYLRNRPAYRFGQKVNSNFVLMFDYEENDISSAVCLATDTLACGGFVDHGDKIILIITLPDDDAAATAFLKSLEGNKLRGNVIIYAFSKKKHQNSKLIDNICGVLLINYSKQISNSVSMNFSKTGQVIDANIAAFPTEGQEALKNREKLFWSTIAASYNDDRMDFLRYYIYRLYCNAATIDRFDMSAVCDDFFNRQVNVTDTSALRRKLEYAVKMIPKITTAKISEQLALKNYFNQCYDVNGFGGDKVVELTLKVNLRMHKRFTELMVNDGARIVFDVAKQYHSANLYGDVMLHLDNYLKNHEKVIEAKYLDIQRFIQTDNDVESDLPEYIKKYIAYDGELKKQEFWSAVVKYIERNRMNFEDQVETSREMLRKLDEIKRDLAYQNEINLSVDNCPSYSAARLINAADDMEICNVIRNAYDKFLSVYGSDWGKGRVQNQTSFASVFNVVPAFSCDYDYDFSAGGTFSVSIHQRIGKYFVFGEG